MENVSSKTQNVNEEVIKLYVTKKDHLIDDTFLSKDAITLLKFFSQKIEYSLKQMRDCEDIVEDAFVKLEIEFEAGIVHNPITELEIMGYLCRDTDASLVFTKREAV